MTDAALAQLWDDRPQPEPDPARLRRREREHCGRDACRCTHTEGCDRGWVDMPAYVDPVTKQTYAPVQPCPVCRPESWARMRNQSTDDGPRVGRRRS